MEKVCFVILAVFVIVAAIVAFILCRRGYKDKVFQVIYTLVYKAEREITGTKRGQERKAQVVAAIHDWLPAWARLFISEQDIDDLIELAVAKLKTVLAQQIDAAE